MVATLDDGTRSYGQDCSNVAGQPRLFSGTLRSRPERGSVILVLATDIAMETRQLVRVARRCGAGLARLGAFWGHGSGDIALAFSTAGRIDHHQTGDFVTLTVLTENRIDLAFRAAAEATEEAVLNAMLAAPATTGRDGHHRPSLADVLPAHPFG